MKIKFKGVLTIEEHLQVLKHLRYETEGTWEVVKHYKDVISIGRVA
jgi:hypothetical protein